MSVSMVNGAPHSGFQRTVVETNNDNWDRLPPGETAKFYYKFGTRAGVKPGEYTFVLQLSTVQSPTLRVRVVP